MTLQLTIKTSDALDKLMHLTDGTKTATINKAIQLYCEALEAQAKGGGMLLQQSADRKPVLMRLF